MIEGILGAILFICLGFVFNEGLWGAAVLFCNVLLAAVIATNFFEPLAKFLESQFPSYTYLLDFLAVWLCFILSLLILRVATDMLSRHRVKFKKPVDTAGGVAFAACIGWLMVQFTLFTAHLAPLDRNFLGFQEKPDTRMFLGLAPDRNWLAFAHTMSKGGSLSRAAPPGNLDAHVFDPHGDFILRYGERRKQFEALPTVRVDAK